MVQDYRTCIIKYDIGNKGQSGLAQSVRFANYGGNYVNDPIDEIAVGNATSVDGETMSTSQEHGMWL